MLLAVDVGNSNIVFGLWDGLGWIVQHRIETHPLKTADEYQRVLKQISSGKKMAAPVTSAIVSSVVPAVNQPMSEAVTRTCKIEPTVLNHKTDTGITLGAAHPERVGADLIADAVGGYALVNDDCIVIDFGTATTVMAVENPGKLTGVAICAGLKVSVEALIGKTAQLQDIPLKIPASPLGKNTVEAMQSGLVLGHLCMVEGLIDRIRKEKNVRGVIATGGLVPLFAAHTDAFDYVEPTLTLDGLRLIAERQESDGDREK